MAKFNTKSILNRGAFCDFSLAPKRKIYKMSMKHLRIHKFPFKKKNCLSHRVQNVPENSAKTSLPWLHFKTDHALRSEGNKVEFLEGRFLDEKLPFLHKKKAEHSFELSLSIFCPLTVFFNLEMQNSYLKTSACWSRGSHFVENGYLSLRFPNMLKVNIHEHWTRVTRFNPLWVSALN